MAEPPLFDSSNADHAQTYRLMMLPSFRPPLVVRLVVSPDGSGKVVAKAGQSDAQPGTLVVNRTSEPAQADISAFLSLLDKADFWSMPTREPSNPDPRKRLVVMDGTEWILEGWKGGEYHLVTRTSPKFGPYTEAAQYLLRRLGGSTCEEPRCSHPVREAEVATRRTKHRVWLASA